MKREFDAIRMEEGEDPLVFLGRIDKVADELAMLVCGENVEEVNRHIVINLSSLYTIQSKSILSRPSIPLYDIDEIIRDAYVNDKLEKEMVSKALRGNVGVDSHALYISAVQPGGGAGTDPGSRGRNKRGEMYKQQQPQQRQQHGHPKQTCWNNSSTNPFGTGGQVPAMGWIPTGPPLGVMPLMPPPPVRNPTGLGPPPNLAPRGERGICYRCHRPGHYVAECPISPAHVNVAVPFTAQLYPHLMYYGGGWVPESSPGSDGYTSTVVPPPQPFSNNPHEQKNDGSCAPTFNPHLLAAQFTQKDKDGRSGIFGENGRDQRIAYPGATFHETDNPVGMEDCNPPLLVGVPW